jgi:hypothetical protein
MPISPIQAQYQKKDEKRKKAKHYDPTDKAREFIGYVENQVKAANVYKRDKVRNAWMALSFYMGRQWIKWNDASGRLEEMARADWQVHLVLNYVRPIIQQLVGKTTENQPGVVVVPATMDSDDRQKARASEKLLSKHYWNTLDMQLRIQDFVRLIYQTGLGIFKVYWDPDAGEEYEMDTPLSAEEQDIVEEFERFGAEHGITPERIKGRTGAPVVDVLSIFEVGWDPGAKSFERSRWCFHENSTHIDDVRSRWKNGEYVSINDAFDGDQLSSRLFYAAAHGRSHSQTTVLADRVRVYEYFEKPSPRYPKGVYGIVAGGVLLEYEEELPHGELPFVVARHMPVHGRIEGDGAITDLIAPQEEINKRVSQRIENANQMLNQKWLVVKGSLVNGEITDQPGEIIEYDAQYPPPRPIAPPPMPSDVGRLQEEMQAHLQNISGVSEIQQGGVPSGISGRAIGMAADAQATVLGPTVREIEAAIKKVCMRLLKYTRDYLPVPILVRILGRDSVPEIFEFHATDIRSTDVIIQRNSMLPRHVSYRREQAMMAFSQGAFGNPQDPEAQRRIRKLLEWGELDELYGDNTKDRVYVREVLHRIAKLGQPVNPEPWEDHVTAIDEIHDFMTSTDYRLLNDELKAEIKRNFAWHYFYKSQLQQAIPWWELPESVGMPPSQQQQSPAAPPPGGQQMPPPIPPEQVFGPEPGAEPPPQGGAAPPAGPGMSPGDLQALLMQAQSGPYGGMPEMNASPHGPGVGAAELGGLTREPPVG